MKHFLSGTHDGAARRSAVARTLLAVTLAFAVFSCAGSPRLPEGSTVLVELQTPEALSVRFGSDFRENPFIAPIGLVQGRSQEFVVLRIDLALSATETVEVQAAIRGPDGAPVGSLYSIEDMRQFWLGWPAGPSNEGLTQRRADAIERYYLPQLSSRQVAGSHTYYLLIGGKRPLPRPASVKVMVFVGSGTPYSREFQLPPPPAS